jgi:transcriptional regulator with XRE-family HTH domain
MEMQLTPGEKIRVLRERAGVKQDLLAEKLGMKHVGELIAIEKGRTPVPVDYVDTVEAKLREIGEADDQVEA